MKHLSEEDLVLRYYGEPSGGAAVDEHLQTCEACRANLVSMSRVLDAMDGLEVPEPLDGLSGRVWQRIAPQLAESRTRWWTDWFAPRRLVAVAAMAALVVGAFLAGRVSQRQTQVAGLSGPVRERIMLGLRIREGFNLEAAARELGVEAWPPERARAARKLEAA